MSIPHKKNGSREASSSTTVTSSASALKKLYRKIWEYGKHIEQETRSTQHTADLFKADLKLYRKRFCDKCCQFLILFLRSSSMSSSSGSLQKVEELLWKRGFYEVVQRCKQHHQALDVRSTICQCYSEHINTALKFYEGLQCKLELEFGVEHSRLFGFNEDTVLEGTPANHLQDLMYKIYIHLGDLARYEVSLGGSPYSAVGFYHQAITLDPSIGTAYNQLAVLSGNKNECLDSIYYYQRSVTSSQPFSGSDSNLVQLFEKNHLALREAELSFVRAVEPDMREAMKKTFLLEFIRIQHILYPGNRAVKDESLKDLCSSSLKKFEQCLDHDDQAVGENSTLLVSNIFSPSSEENPAGSSGLGNLLLPPDLVLKLTALSILPSYSLRQLGSTLTRDASTFALSVLSCLLQHSFRCIFHLVVCSVDFTSSAAPPGRSEAAVAVTSNQNKTSSSDKTDIIRALESGKSIVEIFLEFSVLVASSTITTPEDPVVKTPSSKQDAKKPLTKSPGRKSPSNPSTSGKGRKTGASRKGKKHLIVDRRRKRKDHHRLPSSEEEEEEGGRVGAIDGSSSGESGDSDKTLSLPDSLGEDDLDLLNALSDPSTASSSSEEDCRDDNGSGEQESSSSSETLTLPVSGTKDLSAASSDGTKKGGGSRRQIILAANFSMAPNSNQEAGAAKKRSSTPKNLPENKSPSSPVVSAPLLGSSGRDEGQFVDLVKETDYQAAVYTVCSLLEHEKTLMALRVFVQWLTSFPIVFATCTTQNSTALWSRIARLLNILPSQQDIGTSNVAGSGVVQQEDKQALVEDVLLRGFPPLLQSQETLDFRTNAMLTPLQEVCCRICSLQRFGHFLAEAKTAPLFTWDKATEKFVGPEQKQQREQASLRVAQAEEKKQAELNRSRLMKAMAQRKLQSEVESLAEASNKTEENPLFTPYLIPDATSLCTGLHIVKKLIKTEKFIFIIARSVIEALDNMKKSRESYTAREVIKFLEKELHSGNKYIQAQKPSESLQVDKKRNTKMDMQDWVLERLVDCACYFTDAHTGSKGLGHSVTTLILEKPILDILYGPKKQMEHGRTAELLTGAQQRGVELETMIGFHINWSKHSKKVQREK